MFIGGVEIGIQRSLRSLCSCFDYRVFWVKRRGTLEVPVSHAVKLFVSALTKSWRPDIVVTSLWYAHPLGLLLRLLGCRWIAFFHSSGFSHQIDLIVQRWAWRKATGLFVDAKVTHEVMSAIAVPRQAWVIPYIFECPKQSDAERDIGAVWVGRAVSNKRLDLFVDFIRAFRRWSSRRCVAVVAGEPTPELLAAMSDSSLGLEVIRNQANDTVLALLARARYYVLTSDYEGMSMATVDAVQSGCFPVVRPVGEVRRYLDANSAVLIADGTTAAVHDAAERLRVFDVDNNARAHFTDRAKANVAELGNYVDAFVSGIGAMSTDLQR